MSLPTLKLDGHVITGAVFTVRVAAVVVTVPQEFVKTAWYLFPFCAGVVENVNGEVPLPVFVQLEPPFVLTCHWREGAGVPLAAALKLAVPLAQRVWSFGFNVTAGDVQDGVIV
jgi:hypothetical protein